MAEYYLNAWIGAWIKRDKAAQQRIVLAWLDAVALKPPLVRM